MSNSPENHTIPQQDQTPPQIGHTGGSRIPPNYTPPPPLHFTLTSGEGGSAQPVGTPMTYDQYVDLRSEYRAMMEELKKYNEYRATQPRNNHPETIPTKIKPAIGAVRLPRSSSILRILEPQYSSTERSSGASEPVSTKSRRRKSHTDQPNQDNHVIKAELANVMRSYSN